MNRKWLGNRIRDARERRHLTQEILSEIVDISPTHMSVLERGVKGMKLSTFMDYLITRFWRHKCNNQAENFLYDSI